jgi:hypothetical protein
MTPEVRALIKDAGLSRSSVEQVATMLPSDDLVLDNWIGEAIREADSVAFHVIVYAALVRERPVDARHLSAGARLAGGAYYLAAMAFRVQGEMPEYLLEGLRNTAVYHGAHAMGLLAIAVWCDEHRDSVYPDQLIPQARELVRRVDKVVLETEAFLMELAQRTNDPVLLGLIREHYPKANEVQWRKILSDARKVADGYIQQARRPILEVLPETPIYGTEQTGTVRRAAPRIGRNDPCHCGSGKKYKHCHYEKDQERLQDSSAVAGLTRRELDADTERHLTMELLEKLPAADVVRMNPAAIPRHLLTDFFFRLAIADLDRAAAGLEKLGWDDDLENAWFITMFYAVRTGRKDIGDRLMALRRPFGLKEEDLRLSARLLMARDEPAKWLRIVETAALDALKTEDADALSDLAFGVAHSDASALGLLLYRGVLPFQPADRPGNPYDDIVLPIRERLNLPVEDPLKEFLENRAVDVDLALREAEAKFEAKRREVRALNEELEQMKKDLARRERDLATDSHAPASAVADQDAILRPFREKVRKLESDLKQVHSERNAQERRLERMQARVEALSEIAQSAPTAADAEAEQEEDLLLPQEAEGSQPIRLLEFPRNFLARLSEFPHHVARGAMVILGRLASGDPAAFNGAKRLKSAPDYMRQRVGIDFRLLFRLLPDRIQVIDLIPRQDLERRIKGLR